MSKTKQYDFIINSSAGAGKKKNIWKSILKPELLRRGIHFRAYECRRSGDSAQAAEQIQHTREGALNIVVVGGDGTFNEVLNHISDFSRITFGFIPAGSANDLGYALGIPSDPMQALLHILKGDRCLAMDIGKAVFLATGETRYFAISAGIGLDAESCRISLGGRLKAFLNRLHMGRLIYFINAVRIVFTQPLANVSVTFYDGSGNETVRKLHRLYFLAGMNQPNEGGHLMMAADARPDDGMLSFAMAYDMSRVRALVSLALLAVRKTEHISGYEVIDMRGCRILCEDALEVHTDGETHGRKNEVIFECLPGAVHMYR